MLQVSWQNRLDALEPVALVAFDQAAIELAHKLLSLDDEKLRALQGVSAAKTLFVAGAAAALPWANAVVYLGKDSRAPLILLPTTRIPDVPLDLFERALIAQFPDKSPFAVVENKIVQIGEMRPVARAVVQRWLRENV